LFNSKTKKLVTRQPKLFRSEKDQVVTIWPKVIAISIAVFAALVIIFYLIFLAPWFKIKNIEIIGSPTDGIRSELDSLKGHNIFLFSTSKIEKKIINENSNFSGVKIYRGIPDTIRVSFDDRQPKIVWQSQGKNYLVDENAIAYKEVSLDGNKLPVVVDAGNLAVSLPSLIATNNFLDSIQSTNEELSKLKIHIINYEVGETTFQFSAVIDNNVKIIFNTLRPISDQIEAFKKVYDQHKNDIKQYIDLRVEGRVYYK